MKIKIEMSPEDVTEAFVEYLAQRGFKYVDHEFRDGVVDVTAEPAALQAVPNARRGVPAVPEVDISAVAAAAMAGGLTKEASAVKEEPSLSLSELMSGPSSLFASIEEPITPSLTREARNLSEVDEISALLQQNRELEGHPAPNKKRHKGQA